MYSQKLSQMAAQKFGIEIAFKKAKRDKDGNLILKRSRIVDVVAYIIIFLPLIAIAAALGTDILSEENGLLSLEVLVACELTGVILGIPLLISKTVVSREGITAYRITGKKHIDFIDVESIEYTRFFGGCAVLKGERVKISVPMDNRGFAEFYEILKNRFGYERCKTIGNELNMRRMQTRGY